MKKFIIYTLFAALLLAASPQAEARKKKGHNKQAIELNENSLLLNQPQAIAVTNPEQQLYGEWEIESMKKKPVSAGVIPRLIMRASVVLRIMTWQIGTSCPRGWTRSWQASQS